MINLKTQLNLGYVPVQLFLERQVAWISVRNSEYLRVNLPFNFPQGSET